MGRERSAAQASARDPVPARARSARRRGLAGAGAIKRLTSGHQGSWHQGWEGVYAPGVTEVRGGRGVGGWEGGGADRAPITPSPRRSVALPIYVMLFIFLFFHLSNYLFFGLFFIYWFIYFLINPIPPLYTRFITILPYLSISLPGY